MFAFYRKKKLPCGERRRNHVDERGRERCEKREESVGEDKRRKTKMRPKMRIGPRRGKSQSKVDAEKKETVKKEREKKGGDGERFHEESGWLTDDLIKRGTNYRPTGC